ncbi:MAG: heparan-alpha-glucosaminide N-acetyltransferase domain-containing protein [Cytophagaceae bacterium]|nr:heparan-alpha-glucosaminide N-acetyltransferase domain-containing protein [Cytophagaceae bacterium]
MRLLSLDAFRGLTVAAMILVNNPGDWGHIYAPLEHAVWHGCTPTDLVFPFFLFIVGVSITFSLGELPQQPDQHRAAVRKILVRGLKLFALGLFLNLFPRFEPSTVRIMGVLQRIALVYVVCSLIFLKTTPRQQGWLFALVLLAYWLLLSMVPVPGVGAATLEPETNLGAWLDRSVLGEKHLWKAVQGLWDPEGLFSTLPAIGTGLSGLLAGHLLRRRGNAPKRTVRLVAAGVALVILGLIWDHWFPINKSLWTSSYVCYTSGLALLLLALFYWVADVRKHRRWARPLAVFGVNAITVFFLSGLIPRMLNLVKIGDAGAQNWLYKNGIAPAFSDPYLASLAGAITCVAIWLGILWWMYNRKVMVKI